MGRTVVVDLGWPHARAAREEALLGAALRRVGDDARDLRVARAARREDAPLLARAAALGEDCARRVERRERLARVRDEEYDRAVESRGRVAALRHRAANIPAHTHRFFSHAGCLLCIGRWMSGRMRKEGGGTKKQPARVCAPARRPRAARRPRGSAAATAKSPASPPRASPSRHRRAAGGSCSTTSPPRAAAVLPSACPQPTGGGGGWRRIDRNTAGGRKQEHE